MPKRGENIYKRKDGRWEGRYIEIGFDAKTLSEILGHTSVNLTLNRYVHSSLDIKRANMQMLQL